MHLLRCLFFFKAHFRFDHLVSHIPGRENSAADALSRDKVIDFFSLLPQAPRMPSLVPQALCKLLADQSITWTSQRWRGLFRDSLRTVSQRAPRRPTCQPGSTTCTFVPQYHLTPLPLSERQVGLFATFLAVQGLTAQSITSYISALRHLQIAAGYGAPPTGQWAALHYVIRGIKRDRSTPSRKRLAVTPQILRSLAGAWSSSVLVDHYEARLLSGLLWLPQGGRVHSHRCQSGQHGTAPDLRRLIRESVLSTTNDPMSPENKDGSVWQGGDHRFRKLRPASLPVTAVRNFLVIHPAREGPLLIHADGTPLSREWLVKRFRQALEFCGISCAGYSGHSFRIGAATAAAEAGMPPHLIKTMGRWSSEAYLLYIRTPQATLAAVSSLLACQLESVSTAPCRHPQPVHQLVREQIPDGPASAALQIQNLPGSS